MIEEEMIGSRSARPDWVMIGQPLHPTIHEALWERGHRFLVAASRDLAWAELKTELVMGSYRLAGSDRMTTIPPARETTLTAKLGRYTLASGRTYSEALQAALAGWDPDHPHGHRPQPALPEAREEQQ